MITFIIRRVIFAVVLLLVVSLVTFLLFAALPTDPAALSCGNRCTPEKIEANRVRLGYDKPIMEQYGLFMKGIVAGRTYGTGETAFTCPAPALGYSFNNSECVTSLIGRTLPVSMSVAVGGFVLWMIMGIGLGIVAALRRGRWQDRAISVGSVVGLSFPTFFLALLLLFIFVIWTQWLPFPSYASPLDDPGAWLNSMILPWITIAVVSAPGYIRLTRFGMLDAMNEDYVRLGIATGLSRRAVLGRYVLRGALIPIVTVAAIDFGFTLSGTVFIEEVFSLPGMGRLSIKSVTDSDLPVLVGTTLVAAVFIVVFNLLVDVFYGVVDPRVRMSA
jgi:peptide/nickel transport system permease protein